MLARPPRSLVALFSRTPQALERNQGRTAGLTPKRPVARPCTLSPGRMCARRATRPPQATWGAEERSETGALGACPMRFRATLTRCEPDPPAGPRWPCLRVRLRRVPSRRRPRAGRGRTRRSRVRPPAGRQISTPRGAVLRAAPAQRLRRRLCRRLGRQFGRRARPSCAPAYSSPRVRRRAGEALRVQADVRSGVRAQRRARGGQRGEAWNATATPVPVTPSVAVDHRGEPATAMGGGAPAHASTTIGTPICCATGVQMSVWASGVSMDTTSA